MVFGYQHGTLNSDQIKMWFQLFRSGSVLGHAGDWIEKVLHLSVHIQQRKLLYMPD